MMKNKLKFIKSQIEFFFEVPTLLWEDNPKDLVAFEKQHCAFGQTQTYFQKGFLERLMKDASPNIIYHIKDALEMELAALNLDGKWLFIGPFAGSNWSDKDAEDVLISSGISQANLVNYKLYRCSYQIIDVTTLQKMINAVIGAVKNQKSYLPIYPIATDKPNKPVDSVKLPKQLHLDNSIIQRRYEVENKFIEMIQIGDNDAALEFWGKMKQVSDGLMPTVITPITAQIGSAIIRTLCRQAVKSTGIHFTTLHAITQKYSQNVQNDPSNTEKWTQEFIVDICRAVRESSDAKYSPPVRQAIGYINTKISESISIADIANEIKLSTSQLSRLFRAETGLSITSFITEKRVEKATLMLTFTDFSIQDISNYVGYIDNNYFVKVFKGQHNMTPSEYRKKHKTK